MSSLLAWERLSVQTFLAQGNWQGLPPKVSQPPVVVGAQKAHIPDLASPLATINWYSLSLSDFLDQNNWSGQPPIQAQAQSQLNPLVVPADLDGGLEPVALNWPCLNVEQFFDSVNWSGQRQPIPSQAESSPGFSLTMPVAEFLALIAWEPKPAIAAIPGSPASPTPASREISLSDLSELF